MGRHAFSSWIVGAGLLASATGASADELKWTHFGVRPLAMGNAYVAVADDFNALFYNPAGLARLREWSGELMNPTVQISGNTVSAIGDVQKLLNGSLGDTNAVLDLLGKNIGKTHHFAAGATPYLLFPGFGMAVGLELPFSVAIKRTVTTDVDTGVRLTVPFAYAANFLEDRLSLGVGVKFVARGGISREFSVNDISAFTSKNAADTVDGEAATNKTELSSFVEGGYGAGADVGLLFTPIKTMEPTLGISITDLGGTPYTKANVAGSALGAPKARLPSVNAGLSLKPLDSGGMYLRTSVDAAAINQPVHYSKKFNVGVEWGWGKIIKVQSGLHQGELAGGFEFEVFLLHLRFATYAEQLGTAAGQDDRLSDRRYALQLKVLI